MANEQQIPAWVRVDAALATSGQPDAAQWQGLGKAGLRHVINLVAADALVAGENARLAALAINYLHLPVSGEQPRAEQFTLFSQMLWAMREESVLVHCDTGRQAAVFVFLYRVLYEAAPLEPALADLAAVWEPEGNWRLFMEDMLAMREPAEGVTADA